MRFRASENGPGESVSHSGRISPKRFEQLARARTPHDATSLRRRSQSPAWSGADHRRSESAALKREGPELDSIFDRLNNTRLFTGTHKHRFDAEGRGKGKVGRVDDDVVHSLRQIVRPRFHKHDAVLVPDMELKQDRFSFDRPKVCVVTFP
eukprot:TRINITY_DN11691_c0_g1_i1.p1 TRINITY_DN11691_c0_g1~~TRINITY_DN11691_c0_g1_i1.p1  ORF type:complete len:151 (-),score=14.46 TRINITY_DN11691_c0_g1_i1:241-693(-)